MAQSMWAQLYKKEFRETVTDITHYKIFRESSEDVYLQAWGLRLFLGTTQSDRGVYRW